jgi:hypothetical protein
MFVQVISYPPVENVTLRCVAHASPSLACVETYYFDCCTVEFLYLVQLVFTSYFIIIIYFHLFTLSVFLGSALPAFAMHVAACYWICRIK